MASQKELVKYMPAPVLDTTEKRVKPVQPPIKPTQKRVKPVKPKRKYDVKMSYHFLFLAALVLHVSVLVLS